MTLFVAVGGSGILTTSPDGTTWTARTSGFGTTSIRAAVFGNGLFVAVGDSGVLATSTDATTWTTRTSSFGTAAIYSVAYGNGLFVAVGASGKVATSPDGVTWTQCTSVFGLSSVLGVCYGNGLFVAVGVSGKLATSPDGITWTSRTSGFGSSTIHGVCYGNSRFVAVGDGPTLCTSTDGVTWTARTTGFAGVAINSVAYGGGLYVIVGSSGAISTSSDATTWTARTSGQTTAFNGVTYSNGLYVAVGGSLVTSTDASTWTARTSGFGTTNIFGVAAQTNTAPNAPTLTGPTDGATIDRTATNRFSWTFSDADAGDSQSAFDLRYSSDGGSTWTTVSGGVPNQYVDIASGTFTAGSYEWQVRTYDSAGAVGPWSASRFFTAATPPAAVTITAPINGATISTPTFLVEWSAPAQDAYQVRTWPDDGAGSADTTGTPLTDTGEVAVPGARSRSVAYATNGITVHTQVRIKKNGLWSSYADVSNPVSYTPPATPTLTVAVVQVDGKDVALQVTPAQPTPSGSQPTVTSVDIYRRVAGDTGPGQRYATLQAPSRAWTDWRVASAVTYEYRVRAFGDNGTYTDSAWTGDVTTVIDGGGVTGTGTVLDGGTP